MKLSYYHNASNLLLFMFVEVYLNTEIGMIGSFSKDPVSRKASSTFELNYQAELV